MTAGSKLFGDPRLHALDAMIDAKCAAEGVRDRHLIAARKAAAREQDAALLAANDEDALPVREYVALKQAEARPIAADKLPAHNAKVLDTLQVRVYGTAKDVAARVAATNADLKAHRPVLNERLKGDGKPGSNLHLVRLLVKT